MAPLLDGSALLAGGSDDSSNKLASVERFDPVTQTFTTATSMLTGHDYGIGVLMPNGNYLVASGGSPGANTDAAAEFYNGPPAAPRVALNTTSANFGAQSLGTSQTRFITLSNTGTAPLAISPVAISSRPNGGFTIMSDDCSGRSVAVNSACGVTVRFQPSTPPQSYTGTLSFNDNAAGSPQTVSLSGSGSTSSGPALSLNPSSVTFDNTPMGTTYNAYKAVQITNSGSSALTISSLTLAGGNSGDFGITEYRCQGATLAPNDYCTTYLSFHPGASGGRSATLNIFSNANADPTTPTTVSLSGSGFNGSAPLIDLRSDLTVFGSQIVGTTSAPTNINILNSGNVPLTLSSITFAGNSQNSADFAVNTSACTSQPIAAGTQCAIPVTFHPGAAGVRKAILIVNDSAADTPQLAFVQGTGVQPTTTTVSTTDDVIANDGKCSLREAIIAANTNNASGAAAGECPAGGTGGTILLAKGAVYNLTIAPAGADDATTGDLNILASVSIAVTSGGSATIDAGGRGRVMTIGASGTSCTPTVNITGVTLINGKLSSGSVGHSGGGLNIFCGAVKLTDSAVANSSALNNGGGIAQQGGDLQVIRSTIDGNTAVNGGGGIYSAGTLTVVTSTIYGNTALNGGGGIDAHLDLALTSDTITGNSTGVRNGVNYPIQVQGTIFANVGANCITTPNGGFFSSGGYNLDSRDNCTFRQTGDLHDVNPNLGPLVFHSGLTQTQALLTGSPAIDQIPATNAICQGTKDQQGLNRPVGPKCDIGAYEYAVVSTIPGPRAPGPPLPPGSPLPVVEPPARSPGPPLPPGSPLPPPAPAGR